MQTSAEHNIRIENELIQVGIAKKGTARFAVKFLGKIIDDDEHIMAAVFGRYNSGSGLLAMSSGMLVATNRRVIFLDHKPGYTNIDEISYVAVVGVQATSAGLFSSLILHTRMGNYEIRFASPACIETFRKYIERRIKSADNVVN